MESPGLRGLVAVVTGGGRGPGRAIARELAARGARVAICARTAGEIDAVAREIRKAGGDAISVPIDLSNWKFVERGVSVIRGHFGAVDILVNAASSGRSGPFEEWTVEEIDGAVDVSLRGALYATRALIEEMLAAGRGHVVFLAPDPSGVPPPCTAAAAAAIACATAPRREVKERGVRVTAVTIGPGPTTTPETIARTIADLLETSGIEEIRIG